MSGKEEEEGKTVIFSRFRKTVGTVMMQYPTIDCSSWRHRNRLSSNAHAWKTILSVNGTNNQGVEACRRHGTSAKRKTAMAIYSRLYTVLKTRPIFGKEMSSPSDWMALRSTFRDLSLDRIASPACS